MKEGAPGNPMRLIPCAMNLNRDNQTKRTELKSSAKA